MCCVEMEPGSERGEVVPTPTKKVGLLDLEEDVMEIILSNFRVPFCGADCLDPKTGTVCHQCFAACRNSDLWRDTRTLLAVSKTNRVLHRLSAKFVLTHQEVAESLFARMLVVYLPHGCIRRELNLPLQYALRNGESVNQRTVSLPCRWNYLGRGRALGTLLHYAVEFENVPAICLLLEHNADPSVPDSHSWTPLHLAAAKGRLGSAEALLKYGADPNLRGGFDEDNERGWCPLHLAAVQGDADMTKVLLAHGADPGRGAGRFGDTPLHEFACAGKDITCLPGRLRCTATAQTIRRTFETLVEAAGDGPGGLSSTNHLGQTPEQKGNASTNWLFTTVRWLPQTHVPPRRRPYCKNACLSSD